MLVQTCGCDLHQKALLNRCNSFSHQSYVRSPFETLSTQGSSDPPEGSVLTHTRSIKRTRVKAYNFSRPYSLLSWENLTAVQCASDNMLSPLSRFQPDASSHSSLILPALLFLASLVANVSTPTKNSLLTSAIAWLAVCASSSSKGSARSLLEATTARKTAWAAGLLFALAQVCDKAVDGRAIWWAKVI